MICPRCLEEKTDPIDTEAIENIGECLSCDHLRADIMEDFEEQEKTADDYDEKPNTDPAIN